MSNRSQVHLLRTDRSTSGGVSPPPVITGISPSTATAPRVGAINTLVATMLASGGTAPFVWSITSNPSVPPLAVAFQSNLLRSTANPIGPLGVCNLGIYAVDARGQTFSGVLAVTLT